MSPRPQGIRALLLALVLMVALPAARARGGDPASTSPGDIRFFKGANSSFDRFTRNPTGAQREWMRRTYWRMLTYSPYFDARVSWFPNAWVYKDLYAIYRTSGLVSEHPEWILRDQAGNRLYIPYDCAQGACPQYAADVGDPSFRRDWIAKARATLAKGYRGLFVDDVNMSISRVSDGTGRPVPPLDPRTGREMTEAAWRGYMAEFTREIRATFPDREIVHNALWFMGHDDPPVQHQLLSADVINLERGVNDRGIRSGGGTYGFESLLSHIDWLHAQGKAVIFDATATTPAAREYALAAYFLTNGGGDALGNHSEGTPDGWWQGYDLSLGAAAGPRYPWKGLLRRDFDRGFVLLNPPDSEPRTLDLDRPYWDLAGERRIRVTVGPGEGAVLQRDMRRRSS